MKFISWFARALCGLLLTLSIAQAEECEWTNNLGKTIRAKFVSVDVQTVTLSMTGKVYILKLSSLSPESQSLARELAKTQLVSRVVRARSLSKNQQKLVEQALSESFSGPRKKDDDFEDLAKFDAYLPGNEEVFRSLAWKAYREGRVLEELEPDHKAEKVVSGEYVSPYVVRQVGKMPSGGWPLVIAMHGGGKAPKQVNDQQWGIMQRYYKDQPGDGGYLYLALRAPTDAWNGFYTGYVYPLVARLIRQMLVCEEVDPDKVFLIGYSHGGYGAFAIGPKMADRFAAIHSSAAAPTDGESSPKNLMSTPFTFMIGDRDLAFGRLKRCLAFDQAVKDLRGKRKDAYPVRMFLKKGFGHTGLPDRDQLASILPAVRNPRPDSILWELTDSVVTRFAWLESPEPAKKHLIEATKKGNRFEIKLTGVESLNLYLDERMIDYRKPVVVGVNGQAVVERILTPSLSVLCQTLQERGDPSFAFTSKISIPGVP
jgi:pimeloyl-ACP methyl ester carboxylesterase